MKPDEKSKDYDKLEGLLKQSLDGDLPVDVREKMTKSLVNFRENLKEHPYVRSLESPKFKIRSLWQRWAWAGGLGFLALAILAILFLGEGKPTWAEVSRSFKSVSFFSVVIYQKDAALSEPRQMEIWKGRNGRVRLRVGSLVVFAQSGKVFKVFDIKKPGEASYDPRTQWLESLIEVLGKKEMFSLETVIQTISGKMQDISPRLNTDAEISEDLAVFDFQSEQTTEWIRIWALKESRLPLHVRVWNPWNGATVDAVFSYAKEQPEIFYDPTVFEEKLKGKNQSETALAYMFLSDPIEKMSIPGSSDRKAILNTVARTLDGESWSFAEHAGNAILLVFWNTKSGIRDEEGLKKIFQEYADRKDFILAGVALDMKPEPVRQYCEEHHIPFIQFHEPDQGLDNSLALACGVHSPGEKRIIYRDGWTESFHDPDQLKAAVEGLSYETQHFIVNSNHLKIGMNKEDVIRILIKKPLNQIKEGESEIWNYELPDAEGSALQKWEFRFDGKGLLTNFIGRHEILHPARIKVSFTEEFWKMNVIKRFNPDDLPEHNNLNAFVFSARKGNAVYPFNDEKRDSVIPGKTYERPVISGTYNFEIQLMNIEKHKVIGSITLVEGAELGKDEEKSFQF